MKKWIILILLVLILSSWGGYRFYKIRTTRPAESIEKLQQKVGMPVRIIYPVRDDLVDSMAISGTAAPFRQVVIAPVIGERISAIHVQTGQRVQEQDVLVTLDDTKSRLQVAQAQASLDEAQTSLRELENGSRPEEIAMAKANVEQCQSAVKHQEFEFDRHRKLYEEQVTTLQQLQLVESQFGNAKAQLESAKANYDLVKEGPRKEQIDMSCVRVQLAQVALAQAKEHLADHYLRAAFSGQVTMKQFEVGDFVDVNIEIFKLIDISKVYLDIDVSELYIPRLSEAMPVRITMDSLAERAFTGKVAQINPMTNMNDRSYRTRIVIDNSDNVLRPGMFGRAHVVVSQYDRALVIPADTVRQEADQPYVLAVDDEHVVRKVPIQTGKTYGDRVHVLSGLDEHSRIISLMRQIVQPGDTVTIAKETNTTSPQRETEKP